MAIESSRRQFIQSGAVLACACAGGTAGCARVGSTPAISPDFVDETNSQITVFLEEVPELAAVGGSAKLLRDGTSLMIVRETEEYFAVSALKCSHNGAEVEFKPDTGELRCVSLGHSKFALDGERLGGPAKKPLQTFESRLESADGAAILVIDV